VTKLLLLLSVITKVIRIIYSNMTKSPIRHKLYRVLVLLTNLRIQFAYTQRFLSLWSTGATPASGNGGQPSANVWLIVGGSQTTPVSP